MILKHQLIRSFVYFSSALLFTANAQAITVRPLGNAAVTKSNYSCKGNDGSAYRCYDLSISACEGVSQSAGVTLFVKDPVGASKGLITYHSGSSGRGFWTGGKTGSAQKAFNNLVAAGYTGVQVKWTTGWNHATSSGKEGPMKLACRSATALNWINANLRPVGKPMCSTGNSGGSVQISYAISHYGLSDVLDAIIPTSGPGLGRIDEGCLASRSNPLFLVNQTGLFDTMYGSASGQGPCTKADMSFDPAFSADSIALGDWDYNYPNTYIGMLGGALDKKTATTAQSEQFYNRIIAAQTPYASREILPGVGHSLHDSASGAAKVEQLLKAECRLHGNIQH